MTTALVTVAADIRHEHEAAQQAASAAVAHAVRCGELLLQAKAALPHGAFGPWLAEHVEFSDRTAQGYMRLAKLDDEKRNAVADLPLRGALRYIAESRQQEWLDNLIESTSGADLSLLDVESPGFARAAREAVRPGDPEADPHEMLCFYARMVHGYHCAERILPPESIEAARRGEAFIRARLARMAAP